MKGAKEKRLHKEMGARIRKCLEVRYETQTELARAIRSSGPVISSYISGRVRIPYTHLMLIADHLGVSVHYLLGIEAKDDDMDLWDAYNKRIAEGYEIIWRFDPHDIAKLCGHLGDVMEGLMHIDTLQKACGVSIHMLGKWRDMVRTEGWEAVEKDIKNYLKELDTEDEA